MSVLSKLPSFRDPPVVEVYLSAQFTPIDGFTAAHAGLLWQEFRKELPHVEQHPPIEHSLESFGRLRPLKQQMSFQIVTEPPCPRLWFKSENGNQLIQVQRDRFIHNWRKTSEGDVYPRYEGIRDDFAKELKLFEEFAKREELGRLLFDQCEVSYVNHISLGEDWKNVGDLYRVFGFYSQLTHKEFLPDPEHIAIHKRFLITDDNQPVGRLHLDLESVFRIDNNQLLLRLSLLARLKPENEGIDGVVDRLNLGREWIVRTFADVTTKEMHEVWGRE